MLFSFLYSIEIKFNSGLTLDNFSTKKINEHKRKADNIASKENESDLCPQKKQYVNGKS